MDIIQFIAEVSVPEDVADPEVAYFESYEICANDLEALQQGIDLLSDSNLLEVGVLEELRFVTYDSKNLYVFTRGQHASNERFQVEEVPCPSTTSFKLFKIPHSGFIGKEKGCYRGARAWLCCDEIETTAINGKKFPNVDALLPSDKPRPQEILDVVRMAPLTPYNKIQKGRSNYLTDVVFHEAAHIEHRRLENWQHGEGAIDEFPSSGQKESFLSVIRKTQLFPAWIRDLVLEHINKDSISEMYPRIIDREGSKHYDPSKFGTDSMEFERTMAELTAEPLDQAAISRFKDSLSSCHVTARLLVLVLEEQFTDFRERKRFVRRVLDRNQGKAPWHF